MIRKHIGRFLSIFVLGCSFPMLGQQPAVNGVVPPLVRFSGTLADVNGKPLSGAVGVTFLFYKDQQGGAPLWIETQNVQTDKNGRYSVQLGATSNQGLPSELFISGEARWLGVQPEGQAEQPRVMLLSVPYALKAGDAETVGGLPPSAFVLATPAGSNPASSASANPAATSAAAPPPSSSAVTTTGGTVNALPLWTTATNIQNSALTQTGTGATAKIGINTTAPAATLDVKGTANVEGLFSLPATGTATAAAGKNSQPQDFVASSFNSSTGKAVPQTFQWRAEPAGNNTSAPSGTLNLQFGSGTTTPTETGLSIGSNGLLMFAAGQTFPGTLTTVTAGQGITEGSVGGNVTVSVDPTKVPLLNAANTFTGNQTVNGNVSVIGVVTGTAFDLGSNLFAFGSYAHQNAFLGFSGNTTMTGVSDTGVGWGVLSSNTSGYADTAVGDQALYANTTGFNSTAVGYAALNSNTTGFQNTAVGVNTLFQNTTGTNNTGMGLSALQGNSTGNFNVGYGWQALSSNSTGNNNTGLGVSAGLPVNGASTTGSNNTFIGAWANTGTATTLNNATAIGANAQVTASNAMVLGSIAGVNNATSNVNVGIGTTAPSATLDVHGTGNFTGAVTFASTQTFPGTAGLGANTFTGNQSVTGNLTATGTVSSGVVNAGNGFDLGGTLFAFGNASNQNVYLGFAGNTTTSSFQNTGVGVSTLFSNTTGSNNTGTGSFVLFSNTTGSNNTASGWGALFYNTTGTGNTASGADALVSNSGGQYNTSNGYQSLGSNTSGGFNTAVGTVTLLNNATGSSNTAVGDYALSANTTGNNNVAIGTVAGQASPNNVLTAGNSNTYVGAFTSSGTQTSLTNATAIGANAEVTQSNSLVLGSINGINSATADTNVGIGTTAPQTLLHLDHKTPVGTGTDVMKITSGGAIDVASLLFQNTGSGGFRLREGVGTSFAYLASSGPLEFVTSDTGSPSFPSAPAMAITPAGSVGVGTSAPAATLDVHGTGNFTGPVTFAAGQSFPGTISGVTPGAGLTGGGSSGNVPIAIATNACSAGNALTGLPFTCSPVATLGSNTFNGNQTVTGNATASGTVTGTVVNAGTGFDLGGNLFESGTLANGNAFLGFGGNSTMTGTENTAAGVEALYSNTTGGSNAATGTGALVYNQTGSSNTAVGSAALFSNLSGSNNTGVGVLAGITVDGSFITGADNTFLGYRTVAANGGLSNATAIGQRAEVDLSNSIVLGSIAGRNGASANTNVGIGTTTPSNQLDVWAQTAGAAAISAIGYSAPSGSNTDGSYAIYARGGNGDPSNFRAGSYGVESFGGSGPAIDGAGGSFTGGNSSAFGDGINAMPGSGYAGNFFGDVNINGTIYTGAKDFKIDHPLDPANKYLFHGSVESSEMKNIYDGVITSDAQGGATVTLPDWFEVLNTDFRYQLTVIGQFAQAIVAREIQNREFTIRTNAPNVKVSWQVTGVRQDAYAKAHPLVVEQEKEDRLRGFYIHPELYGAPEEKQIEWARHAEMMKRLREERAKHQSDQLASPPTRQPQVDPKPPVLPRFKK